MLVGMRSRLGRVFKSWGAQALLLLLSALAGFIGGRSTTSADVVITGDDNSVVVRVIEGMSPLEFCQRAQTVESDESMPAPEAQGVFRVATFGVSTLEWRDNGVNSIAFYILPGAPSGPVEVAL